MSFVEFTGRARLGRRTKNLVARLGPDDVAIIDHQDIDRVSAEELLESGVRVVVNVARSQSGRFPNPGPLLLVRGGVRLIDAPGAPLFDELSDGDDVSVRGASVFRNGTCLANGRSLGAEELARALAEQQSRVTEALEGFAENTLRYLRDEGRLLAEGVEFPPLETRFRDRHALVVARGPGLQARPRDRPALRARLQAGARRRRRRRRRAARGRDEAARDRRRHGLGLRRAPCAAAPSSSCTPTATAQAPGAPRLERLGLQYSSVSAPGISEDIALLLAFEKGAELIVAVGTHFNLTEFLERDRAGMSSTFVTRLKVGEILIDAKGVSRLVSRQVGLWPLILFAAAGLGAVVVGDRRLARPAALHRPAQPADPRPARPRVASSRMPTYTARKELLAPLEDVWLFLAEPHHLSDWWPGVAGVTPDRRGLAPGARWKLHAPMRPALLRRPASESTAARCIEVEPPIAGHLVHDRRAPGRRAPLEDAGNHHTNAELTVSGPFMVGLRRTFPRTALNRLYALCQTAAEL